MTARSNSDTPFTWPRLLDYNHQECHQLLRCLELEAYEKVVSAYRAQGPLTVDKRKSLMDLQRLLSISIERHRAEVRRAVNDEELCTVSQAVCGQDVDEGWMLEGKRVAPLLHRPTPETAYLPHANRAAHAQSVENHRLPSPIETALNIRFKRINAKQPDQEPSGLSSKSEGKTESSTDFVGS